MSATRTVQASTVVSATVHEAFDTVADLTRMGEWSSECTRVRWKGRTDGAASGARFRGYNRHGWHRWSTSGRIVELEPDRLLTWKVSFLGLPMAQWSYRFEETGQGCRITETWEDRQLFLTRPPLVGWLVTGVWRRADRNSETMEVTLTRIKNTIEAGRSVHQN